jgi:hypothetical protein
MSAFYPRSCQAYAPESGEQDLKKRPARREISNPLAGQVSGKMSASGWQTAPLQAIDLEVVLVTKSACRQQLLEGSPGVSDLYHPAVSPSRELSRGELFTHPMNGHPVIHSSSRLSRILSDTPVSAT